jgi:hypothetical protein
MWCCKAFLGSRKRQFRSSSDWRLRDRIGFPPVCRHSMGRYQLRPCVTPDSFRCIWWMEFVTSSSPASCGSPLGLCGCGWGSLPAPALRHAGLLSGCVVVDGVRYQLQPCVMRVSSRVVWLWMGFVTSSSPASCGSPLGVCGCGWGSLPAPALRHAGLLSGCVVVDGVRYQLQPCVMRISSPVVWLWMGFVTSSSPASCGSPLGLCGRGERGYQLQP